jgi:hypothetical protein
METIYEFMLTMIPVLWYTAQKVSCVEPDVVIWDQIIKIKVDSYNIRDLAASVCNWSSINWCSIYDTM